MTADILLLFDPIDNFVAVSAPGGTKFERNIRPNLDVRYSLLLCTMQVFASQFFDKDTNVQLLYFLT